MAESNVEAMVKEIVIERLDVTPEQVTLDARFNEDLGADSLDQVELIMALEERFGINIEDDVNGIVTVGDAVKYIEARLPE
ncbi:MAG TPA: acyl carrier protein [Candidatus Hydrogenedentes bacterium]|mgnify:CR=1 FL=1|nr:acyl carrier protein [Candidatus Hydrogenedentota bacterium]